MLKHRNLRRLRWGLAATVFTLPSPLAGQAAAAADSAVYVIDRSSVLLVHAGKSGLLKGLGHEHQIRAHAFGGTVLYVPGDIGRSQVSVTVLTDSLRVVPEADSADIPKITETMRTKTLRVDSFPEITFVSREATAIDGAAGEAAGAARPRAIRVTGDLTMAGRARPVSVDLILEVRGDTLRADGSFVVKQTDFGIKPYKTALGLVKVKDEVRFELDVVAVRQRPLQ